MTGNKLNISKYELKNLKKLFYAIVFICILFFNINVCSADWTIVDTEGKGNVDDMLFYKIPDGYECIKVIDDLGEYGTFNAPEDLFISNEGNIYVVDTGNNRVVMLDENYEIKYVYGYEEKTQLNNPLGIFVDEDGDIYVADTENERTVHISRYGDYVEEFSMPDSDQLNSIKDFKFKPEKLVINNNTGYFFVVRANDIMIIDSNNAFRRYFNTSKTSMSLSQSIIRFFLSKEEKANLYKSEPSPVSNIIIDEDNLIYAVAQSETSKQIKKFNLAGENIFPEKTYGLDWYDGITNKTYSPSFIDIAIDTNKIVYVLEKYSKMIYRYNQEGICLSLFGGYGDVKGSFIMPVSIAIDKKDNVYVLDKQTNCIQVFTPTYFTGLVNNAERYNTKGLYDEAAEIWEEALEYCNGYPAALNGMGRAYYGNKEWEKAAGYFKLAKDKQRYSDAFAQIRYDFVINNFGYIVLGIILIIVIIIFAVIAVREYTEDVNRTF